MFIWNAFEQIKFDCDLIHVVLVIFRKYVVVFSRERVSFSVFLQAHFELTAKVDKALSSSRNHM
jgi:hypothetical protein